MTSLIKNTSMAYPNDDLSSNNNDFQADFTLENDQKKCLNQFVDSNAMAELEAIFIDSSQVASCNQHETKTDFESAFDPNEPGVKLGHAEKNEKGNSTSNQAILVNHSSSLNSNSSTSGYTSGRSSPSNSNMIVNLNNLENKVNSSEIENGQKSKLESMNSLIDDLIILNNSNENESNQVKSFEKNPINRLNFFNSISNINDKQQNTDNNQNYSNLKYFIRREKSLDRCSATESFFENYNPSSTSASNTPSHRVPSNQFPTYSNSTLYLNTIASRPNRQHQRSNSIINTSSNVLNLNYDSSNFTRDFDNTINACGALKPSNKALSSNSIQRDTSINSLKSFNQADSNQSKINFIKDLQIRLMDMQKESYYLRCELETCQQKLSSNMQSIKQFWSPELKRERQMRKEEQQKFNVFLEKFKILQAQNANLMSSFEQQTLYVQQLEIQIEQVEQEKFVQHEFGQNHNLKSFSKEKSLLKKTINELEMRINTQKQSLNTKDETIKKLFQIVKTLSTKNITNSDLNSLNSTTNEILQQMNQLETLNQQIEATNSTLMSEQNKLRERLLEEEQKNYHLQQLVSQLQNQKSTLISPFNINTSYSSLKNSKIHALRLTGSKDSLPLCSYFDSNNESNLLIEANKDTRIKQLELQIKQLEDEIANNKKFNQGYSLNSSNNANLTSDLKNESSTIPSSLTQLELLKTNEKFFKEKIETLKSDLSRKETEIQQIKTKYETCESKEKDLQHYVTLLKESLATKEQQITMQHAEVNEIRNRIKEKENLVEKKNQQIQQIQLEKHQRDSDIGELKDQMDIKERKINVLNRKIENLEEQLKDKEMQINTLRTKLSSSSMGFYQNNVMQNLEQSLEQKEKLIEKLTKDAMNNTQSQSHDTELTEQIETLNISIKELNEKIELKNKEIQDYQNEIYDLKDEVESFKTQLIRKDSHVNSLEMSLTQKNEEIEIIEEKLHRLQKQQFQMSNANCNQNQQEVESMKKVISNLQKDLQSKETNIQQLTTELITLKELIDDFEEQKQVLKSKLEQQQIQFSHLEERFEQSTQEFQLKLTKQQEDYENQIENLKFKNCEQSDPTKETNDEKYEKIILNLREQIEEQNDEAVKRDDQIDKLNRRIKDLEEALRESVSITAERELVFAQQRSKTEQIENEGLKIVLQNVSADTRIVSPKFSLCKNSAMVQKNKNLIDENTAIQKSINEQQLLFNRYQEELYIREERLQKLEEEKVKEMNELLITKQEILLSTISEKDSAIAELECNRTSTNKAKIQRLMEEKDNLHHQLKDLNEQRMKLMNDYMSAKDAKDKVKILAINPIMAHDEDGIYA